MSADKRVMVDATFARPGRAFGATSYAEGFLLSHFDACERGESGVELLPFLPREGFAEIERAYGDRARRSQFPGYLGRLETSTLSHTRDNSTLFHWLGNHVPPAASRRRCVVTLHDFMAKHYLDSGYPTPKRMIAAYHRALRSLRWAEGVVVSDDLTRDMVLGHAPGTHVVIAPPGPGKVTGVEQPEPVPGVNRPFLLVLGANGPQKRLEQFRDAFLRCPLPAAGWTLIHAGRGTDWGDPGSRSITHLSDRKIAWLLENCEALAMPSSYEGWGMPVAEAAIFNRPILVSDGVPSRHLAAEIAPVYVLNSLDDAGAWDFLVSHQGLEAASLQVRRERSKEAWRSHVAAVESLYASLGVAGAARGYSA